MGKESIVRQRVGAPPRAPLADDCTPLQSPRPLTTARREGLRGGGPVTPPQLYPCSEGMETSQERCQEPLVVTVKGSTGLPFIAG